MRRGRLTAAAVALVSLGVCAGNAAAITYAPVDQPGQPLSVPADKLAQSLRCADDLVSSGKDPVLLIPPTLVTADEAWFSHEHAFDDLGIPYCTVTVPNFTTGDIQVSAEYTVNAVRQMHARTGRKVHLLGWSQGAGPEPLWALRWWPDIRPMVDELIGYAAPSHGTFVARGLCLGSCVPALWQQLDNSAFVTAMTSRQETFPGIDYTNVYSHTDEFVQPDLDDTGTSSLHGGGGTVRNIATQDVCPLDAADHLAYYYDPVGYALAIDALTHPGPADPARIDPGVCNQLSMPYQPIADVPLYSAALVNDIFVDRINNQPRTTAEPALKCYVTASCPPVAAPAAKPVKHKAARKRSRHKKKKRRRHKHRR